MANEELGRLPTDEIGKTQTLDDPTVANQALVSKMDELIDVLKAFTAKLDGLTVTGMPSDFASDLTDTLEKLLFRL